MTNLELTNKVRATVNEVVDAGYPICDIFDEFCNRMDTWLDKHKMQAYIRVFWYNETDLDEALDDISDIFSRFDIQCYCNQPSAEIDACFSVLAYPKE